MSEEVSCGHHSKKEVYEHRYLLFIALCKALYAIGGYQVWRSKTHADPNDPMFEDSFILWLYTKEGKQIDYHLPLRLWEATDFAETDKFAPAYDGHSSLDVLNRLQKLIQEIASL